MNQNERLDFLVEQFAKDYEESAGGTASRNNRTVMKYRRSDIPADAVGKRRILRSMMNIRMPGMMPSSVLEVQDAYL